ncbi:MAG: hypothetical protein KZQ91_12240 [Candidatus Thiodiazotropha sp. (ex Lucinoma borealis)]|nr:hypothetical protein [Candidatus Thiodiazotropha sp. (ex Lucinoma borealis)]
MSALILNDILTVEQHRFLQRHSCDFFQGYLFSPAVSANEFKRLLECEPDDPASTVNQRWKHPVME